jgi:hypothetical protein
MLGQAKRRGRWMRQHPPAPDHKPPTEEAGRGSRHFGSNPQRRNPHKGASPPSQPKLCRWGSFPQRACGQLMSDAGGPDEYSEKAHFRGCGQTVGRVLAKCGQSVYVSGFTSTVCISSSVCSWLHPHHHESRSTPFLESVARRVSLRAMPWPARRHSAACYRELV